VLSDCSVLALFTAGPVFYAFFYPQPHSARSFVTSQSPWSIRTARTQSRTPGHGGARQSVDRTASHRYREAEDAIFARRAFGVVGIPGYRAQTKRVEARLPVYADSTYFPVQSRSGHPESWQAYAAALSDAAVALKARRCRPLPPPASGAVGHGAAVQLTVRIQLRRSGGICPDPASDLLMGSAMWAAPNWIRARRCRRARARCRDLDRAHALDHLCACSSALLRDHARVCGFSTLGSIWQIAALSFPFILATASSARRWA
jgi:hypothetical protein